MALLTSNYVFWSPYLFGAQTTMPFGTVDWKLEKILCMTLTLLCMILTLLCIWLCIRSFWLCINFAYNFAKDNQANNINIKNAILLCIHFAFSLYRMQFTLHLMIWTLYPIQSTLHQIQSTLYLMQTTLHTMQSQNKTKLVRAPKRY